MYSVFVFILLISSAIGYSSLFPYGYEDYFAYASLIRNVASSDSQVKYNCLKYNYRTTVSSGDGYYILKYYLYNIVEDSVNIEITNRVLHVDATLENGRIYRNLKILPEHVLVDGAVWKIIDGHLNVIMGSKLWAGKEVDLACENDYPTIRVKKAPSSPEDL